MLQTLTILVDNLHQIHQLQLLESRIFCTSRSINKMYPEGAVCFDYPVESMEQDCFVQAVFVVQVFCCGGSDTTIIIEFVQDDKIPFD
jgi:hypothetical protein